MSNIYSMHMRGNEVVGFMSDENFTILDELIQEHDVKSVIELGTFVGMLACWLAERVGDVIAIDHFNVADQDYKNYIRPIHEDAAANQYETFIRNTLPYPNIRGYKMTFEEAAELPFQADLIYVDAVQPSYLEIVEAWMPKARKIIAGDDLYAEPVKAAAKAIEAEGLSTLKRTWWKIL